MKNVIQLKSAAITIGLFHTMFTVTPDVRTTVLSIDSVALGRNNGGGGDGGGGGGKMALQPSTVLKKASTATAPLGRARAHEHAPLLCESQVSEQKK